MTNKWFSAMQDLKADPSLTTILWLRGKSLKSWLPHPLKEGSCAFKKKAKHTQKTPNNKSQHLYIICKTYRGPRRLTWCHWPSLPAFHMPQRRRCFTAELCGFTCDCTELCSGSRGCRRSPASPALRERSACGLEVVSWMQNLSCCHA